MFTLSKNTIANGFTGSQHNAVAAKIGAVFKHALLLGAYNDRNNDPNIESMKRFATPIMVDGERAMAFLTVKSTFQKKGVRGEKARNEVISRLYSVELDEIVKLDGQLKRLDHLRQNASASSSEEIISRFEEKVKSVFSEKSAMNEAEAEAQAWQELGELVQQARAAVLKADPQAEIEEVKPGDRMSIIEALSTMATSKFVASGAVPGWMQGLTAALKGNLAAADSLAKVRAAYASVLQNDPAAVSELDAMLDKLGVYVQDTFREARIEAVDIQAWKHARALVTARAESPAGSGGAPVSEVVQQARENYELSAAAPAELRRDKRVAKDEFESSAATPQEVAREAQEILDAMVPGSNAPAEMQGVFVDDKCYYNAAGGFWCGMIDKNLLRDGTEQVKVGAKGKHGVIAGRELTGRFQQNVGAIYVWKRTNGELQVISGRHRFAKLMEDDTAQSCNAYVFVEDAEHDERWARMLDYENNMRDDQADEVTAATYVRETGLSDAELEVRGLMRNGTRCKRGALIGRHAREELWTRFSNGAVKPMDAEIICNLTRSIRDQSRVEEIQRRCCMLLDEKKSWEYIGAMVQLMANKENVVLKQGLLDFGADFEADLARAAEWIERNIKAINESVTLLKQGRKLSGKKRAEAERLGISTATQEGTEQMLYDLEQLRAQFEMIGSYPDLVAAAQMWDGKTPVDPVGQYLEHARAEREQVRAEGEMDVEEYLKQQQAEATGTLFSMSMERNLHGLIPFSPLRIVDAFEQASKSTLAFDEDVREENKADLLRRAKDAYFQAKSKYFQITRKGWTFFDNKKVRLEELTLLCHFDEIVKSAIPVYSDSDTESGKKYNYYISGCYLNNHSYIILLESEHNSRDFVFSGMQILDEAKTKSALDSDTLPRLNRRMSGAARAARATSKGILSQIAGFVKYIQKKREEYAKLSPEQVAHLSEDEWLMYQTGEYKEFTEGNIVKDKYGVPAVFYRGLKQPYNPKVRRAITWVSYAEDVSVKHAGTGHGANVDRLAVSAKKAFLLPYNRTRKVTAKEFFCAVKRALIREQGELVTQEIQQKLDELAESFAYKKDYAFKYWDNRDKELKAIAEQFGYDSFLAAEDGEWTLGLFSPGQAKSLTQGIGLMDRGNPDITFSMERNLAAVHSLSPEKFLAALELGGMPMPSVAVTRLDRPYGWGGADGTFMKAPNGKPTKLTERQWLQVRTGAFKQWFGDWENVSLFRVAYNRIMSMASVASLSGKEFGRGLTPEKMAEHWQTICGGKVKHAALGEVVLTKRSAKDCLAHGVNREKAAVFAKVHEVIRHGVVFDRQKIGKNAGMIPAVLLLPLLSLRKSIFARL